MRVLPGSWVSRVLSRKVALTQSSEICPNSAEHPVCSRQFFLLLWRRIPLSQRIGCRRVASGQLGGYWCVRILGVGRWRFKCASRGACRVLASRTFGFAFVVTCLYNCIDAQFCARRHADPGAEAILPKKNTARNIMHTGHYVQPIVHRPSADPA